MDFGLTDEQRAIVATTRAFVERELYPHEEEVERTGVLRPELRDEIAQKAIRAGPLRRQHARGGRRRRPRHGDLGALREGARQGQLRAALHRAGRPSNILLGGTDAQKEKYLYPCVRGERRRLHGA